MTLEEFKGFKPPQKEEKDEEKEEQDKFHQPKTVYNMTNENGKNINADRICKESKISDQRWWCL
jgi:hypothetical protein